MKQKHAKQLKKNKISALLVVLVFAVVGAALLVFTNAAPPSGSTASSGFSLSPNSASKAKDSTFAIDIYVNSGSDPVASVEVQLSYDAAKLQYVSIEPNGGALPDCFGKTGGSGTASMSCLKTGAPFPTGANLKVGTVTFKALSGSGTTSLSFAANSHIWKADGIPTEMWNGVTTGGTYTLTGGTTTNPPTTGGGTGGSGSSSGGSTGSTTPKTTTSSGSPSSTPKTTTSTGQSSGGQSSSATPAPTTTETQSTQPNTGYAVAIKVADPNGKIVTGAQVKLDSMTAITDASGIASFVNVTAGKHKISISSKAGKLSKQINVLAATTTNEVQLYDLKLKKPFPYIYILILPGLIVVGLLVKYIMNKRAPWGKITPSGGAPSAGGGDAAPTPMSTFSNPSVIVDPKPVTKPITTEPQVAPAVTQPATPTTSQAIKGQPISVIQPADKPQAAAVSAQPAAPAAQPNVAKPAALVK